MRKLKLIQALYYWNLVPDKAIKVWNKFLNRSTIINWQKINPLATRVNSFMHLIPPSMLTENPMHFCSVNYLVDFDNQENSFN